MSVYPLSKELHPVNLPLDAIYLDPNNPRFVDDEWTLVPDDEIDDEIQQEEAQRLLVKKFAVMRLRANMEVNGYLPIDRVIVRQFKEEKYVVLEGNRRICAAKLIAAAPSTSADVTEDVRQSLQEIPCLLYGGEDEDAAWIFQGLRHITGIMDWPAFNKAKLIAGQVEEEGLSLTEVGKRFGLTSHGAGQWMRGFKAWEQAKEETDYVDVVDDRSYPYFQEIFNRSSVALKEWLKWDDDQRKCKDGTALNEFAGWLYPRPEVEDDASEPLGEWEDKLFDSRDDLRKVADLMTQAPDLFQHFRDTKDFGAAYAQALSRKYQEQAKAQADEVADVFDSLDACTKALRSLPFNMLSDASLRAQLEDRLSKLEEAIQAIRTAQLG